MKTNEPDHPDAALKELLQAWRTDPTLPPRFQELVWARIQRTERAPAVVSAWRAIAYWIDTVLPRPALAASYVAILVAVGLTAGWAQARQETVRIKGELGQRYVSMLDPYFTPRR